MNTIGNKIAALLRDKGMSQRDLSKLTGISEGLISQLVNNKKTSTTLANIRLFAKALKVPVALLTNEKVYSGADALFPFVDEADVKYFTNPKKRIWLKFNDDVEALGYTPERALKILKKLKELEGDEE